MLPSNELGAMAEPRQAKPIIVICMLGQTDSDQFDNWTRMAAFSIMLHLRLS